MLMSVEQTLREIRQAKGLRLKRSCYISGKIRDYAGRISDCDVRNYQAIGILNIVKMSEFVLGDEPGLGKTLEALYAYAYLRHYYFIYEASSTGEPEKARIKIAIAI